MSDLGDLVDEAPPNGIERPDPDSAAMQRLQEEVEWQAQALKHVSAELAREAQSRGWCEDYEGFVARINRELGKQVLQDCFREQGVSFQVSIGYMGRIADQDRVRTALRTALQRVVASIDTPEGAQDLNWTVDFY